MKKFLLTAIPVLALCSCAKEDVATTLEESACAGPAAPVLIEGGTFVMGSDVTYPEEGPAHEVSVSPFRLDPAEVTVSQFEKFVAETGYVTVAERPVDASPYEGLDIKAAEALEPGGAVFTPDAASTVANLNWWRYVPGANWRRPKGPGAAAAKAFEPVTQIAFEDAAAYAAWAGGRLPTEAEWEYAARAGGGQSMNEATAAPAEANTWQGIFPVQNSKADGYEGIAPAGCFAPNAFGLYDMIGNVWEWTADWYAPAHSVETSDPHGPSNADSHDPNNPQTPVRVIKGGSYLCAENYCIRYRPAARQAQDTGLGTNHIGFRVAYDLK